MKVVLSYGLGVDSTALLLRWLSEPDSRDFDLSDLLVVTAMTGDEWPDTVDLVERHVLPRLAEAGVTYAQVARGGASQKEGIAVLEESDEPHRLYADGAYRLSDELTRAGTIPQAAGSRYCSQNPICAACGRSTRIGAILCTRCARRLISADPMLGNGPAGCDRAWSSAPYEGVARDLVAALRFRHLRPVADLMAERIEWLAPAHALSGTIVPVPAVDRRRSRSGSFEPAAEIARALAERLDSPCVECLERPHFGPTSLRRRHRRSRIAHPPLIRATAPAPRSILLIADLLNTDATLTACARALRAAGASRVVAITFARRI
jgi:predicted amidophosphoribosyltransferase